MFAVLRLLAVYLGTVALVLALVRRHVRRFPPVVGLFLALAPLLLTGRAIFSAGLYAPADILYQAEPFASRAKDFGIGPPATPALGDVAYQSIAWHKAAREAFRRGRVPLWNRFLLAGEPLLAVEQAAIFHPATWIGCLLPLPHAWTYSMALRTFLALFSAYLFFADLGVGELAALLGAAGWALGDWLVFYSGYSLTLAAPLYPLVLLGLRRLAAAAAVREPAGERRALGLLIVTLLLIVLAGHPESLLYAVTGGGIYFLFALAWAGRGRWQRPLRLSLIAGALTLGLSAVQLLPFAEALPRTFEHFFRSTIFTQQRKSVPLEESVRRGATSLVPYAYGVSGLGRGEAGIVEPAAYAGTLLLPFALLGLASRRREKWPLLATGALGLAVFTRLLGATDLLGVLPLFNIGSNDRLIFLTLFALAAFAVLGVERLREAGGVRLFAAAALGTALAVLGIYFLTRPEMAAAGLPSSYTAGRLALQLVPLLAALGLVAAWGRSRAGAAVALCLALLLAQRTVEAGSLYPSLAADSIHPRLPALDHIPPGEPWRFVAVGYTFLPNTPTFYELEDVRGYEAMTFMPLWETYPLWCQHQPVWFNRVDDAGRPFLSFLNVRWAMTAPGGHIPAGWTLVHADEGGSLFENPHVLARAFVPKEVYREPDPKREMAVLRAISDYGERGVASVAPGSSPPRTWVGNGPASVAIARYEAQELAMDVRAQAPALIATSVVAWPGWRLTLDGQPAPTASYNHAFLGFLVPPGRHRAVLTYWPASFTWGAWLSLGSLVLCVFWLGRYGRSAA